MTCKSWIQQEDRLVHTHNMYVCARVPLPSVHLICMLQGTLTERAWGAIPVGLVDRTGCHIYSNAIVGLCAQHTEKMLVDSVDTTRKKPFHEVLYDCCA